MLKVSLFRRGFSQSTKLDSRYTSEEENSRGHSFLSSLLCHVTLRNTHISNTHILRCADEYRYFSKVTWLHCNNITSYWGWVSPGLFSQELCLSNLCDHRPSRTEDNFNFTFRYNNLPMLFCFFIISNSSFLTTGREKLLFILIFIKKCLIYKFKVLSLLKRLCRMSSTTYICDPLPVTPCRYSMTQNWPTKPLQWIGMKFYEYLTKFISPYIIYLMHFIIKNEPNIDNFN